MNAPSDFLDRARRHLILVGRGVKIKRYLGGETDGHVWQTGDDTALKVFKYDFGYANERDTYVRLAHFGVVEQIDGFWVPKMLDCNDELMVVEMDLMQHAPYIIDFAKVRLNSSPEFSEETLRYHSNRGAKGSSTIGPP